MRGRLIGPPSACTSLDQLIDHYEQHAADAHHTRNGRPVVRTLSDGKPTATTGITDPDLRRALLQREELLHRTKPQPPHTPPGRPITASTTHPHRRITTSA